MAPRSLGDINIFWGKVTIAVRVYSATSEPSAPSFSLLHERCGSKAKQQYVCPTDNALLEKADLVKGYEAEKGRYVVFSSDELSALDEPLEPGIEFMEWIDLAKVDPVYFAKPYNLGPDRGGEKGYRLLVEIITRMGKVPLARWSSKGKQRLVLLRVRNGALVMQTLLHAEEVRDQSEIEIPPAEVAPAEVKLGIDLAKEMATEAFQPEKWPDEQKVHQLALIAEKVKGGEIRSAPVAGRPRLDLLAALEASVRVRPGPHRAERDGPKVRPKRASK